MACQVRYLSSAGIQHREVKGVEALAAVYPINWLMYASLTAFPRNSAPIEIDLLVIMDDRIVLLELKDWNGPLSAKNDVWIHAGKKERSPVVLGNEKAKKIKGILQNQISHLRTFVDSRVVLTGTSTRDFLPEAEKPHVLTLEEAKLLANRNERNRLLGTTTLSAAKPNMRVKDFEKLLGNGSYFQPLKMTWDGYGVTDEDFYVHRGDIWREHRAQLVREERMKALLRLWRFDKLPVSLNEPIGRRLISDRELRAMAYLDEHGSWMAERGILKQLGAPPDEVLTEHHQLLSVPSGWTTLRRYLARYGADVLGEQRVDIVHTLALMVAELHFHDIAHRDIGGDAVWMGAPTNMSLTGFFSASVPDDTSIPNYLDVLGTYSEKEPDWNGVLPTAKERDVRSIGLVMKELAALGGDTNTLPEGWASIADRALAVPGERYPDARTLAEALGELKTPSGPTIDQSRLDDFQTEAIPYVEYPATGPVVQGLNATRYESEASNDRVLVKVWNGLLRGDAQREYALLAMLEAAASLKAVPIAGVASVIACGLSPVGPFLVTRWVEGTTLATYDASDEETLLKVLKNLVASVDALHARGLAHGDLHPENVLVDEHASVTLIDVFDTSRVGEGRLASPAWAPEDRERCSNEQIDRFAVCRMVNLLIGAEGSPIALELGRFASSELERRPIETLKPIAEAIEKAMYLLLRKPAPSFSLTIPGAHRLSFSTDEGKLWVKGYRTADLDVLWVTGLDARLLLRLKNGDVEAAEISEAPLVELGRGTPVEIEVSIEPGFVTEGAAELASYLMTIVQLEEQRPAEPLEDQPEWEGEEDEDYEEDDQGEVFEEVPVAPVSGILDVKRMWLRAAEIEEETVLQVRVDRRLSDVGNVALYEYETPRPLEFEDDDDVEVRQGGMQGRRIGFLDVPRCEQRQLAIRDQRHPLADGEFVSLVDRRDRVSKERRRRAVERITGGGGVIPNLIDYFDPAADTVDIEFDLQVSDDELKAYGLNEGQRRAFRTLLQVGPVGMLQGPPGSGKTRFIASFAHWLLTKGGARRVLIASQSHEAVNNVLEEVLKTYRARGGSADLLRVGSRGATERVRPYQARSLRERYKVRFENGLKARVTHAAAAAGIMRPFVHDVVQIDQQLGALERAMELARLSAEAGNLSEERRRSETRLRRLEQAFTRSAVEILGTEMPTTEIDIGDTIETAYREVLAAHPKASPGDLSTVRRLLALANEWKDTLGTGHRNFDEFLAKTCRVVAGTCVGLGQSQIRLEQATFDWVIVDEAARCTSGELAVPLQLGSRVVLVGDQLQLRPMVERAVQRGLRDEFRELGKGLAQSDFERAFASPYGRRNARVLDEQYRMTPTISKLVSDVFYAPHGVRLEPSPDREADSAFANLPADLAQPVVWFNTANMQDAEERDRNLHRDIWNEAEIRVVITQLHRLSREQTLVEELSKRSEPAIGVICMYSEQKRRIEREWSQQPFSDTFRRIVTIDTVDAYQGKENAIVIVTLVRANDQKLPGHVGRENRCNVAMSRAKERLYIVGNAEMWSSLQCGSPMRTVLNKIDKLKEADGEVRNAAEIFL